MQQYRTATQVNKNIKEKNDKCAKIINSAYFQDFSIQTQIDGKNMQSNGMSDKIAYSIANFILSIG